MSTTRQPLWSSQAPQLQGSTYPAKRNKTDGRKFPELCLACAMADHHLSPIVPHSGSLFIGYEPIWQPLFTSSSSSMSKFSLVSNSFTAGICLAMWAGGVSFFDEPQAPYPCWRQGGEERREVMSTCSQLCRSGISPPSSQEHCREGIVSTAPSARQISSGEITKPYFTFPFF